MPQYNRSNVTYRKLGYLSTNKLQDAKLTASLNIVAPKEISRKKIDEFLDESHKAMAKAFKKFIDKEAEKAEEADLMSNEED